MCLITRKRDVEKKKKIGDISNSKLQVNHCQNQKKKIVKLKTSSINRQKGQKTVKESQLRIGLRLWKPLQLCLLTVKPCRIPQH